MSTRDKLIDKSNWEELKKNPVNRFVCLSCSPKKEISPEEFKKHLVEVHKIDTKKPGTKKMVAHIDSGYWFSSTYEWVIDGVRFIQYLELARETFNHF